MHTLRHVKPLITYGKSIFLLIQTRLEHNQCVGLVTWIRAYKLLVFKVLREHYWPWNNVWLGNSESSGFILLPNQNQCHCLLNNTQNSCLWQLHTKHCNMTGNGELWHFPTNPAEAVNKESYSEKRSQLSGAKECWWQLDTRRFLWLHLYFYLNGWNFSPCIHFSAFCI